MEPIKTSSRAVLLVDDDPSFIAGVKRALRREPYEIFGATSAKEAFSILRTLTIDVLVVDQQMPRINGVQLLTAIRRSYPSMKRIMLSGKLSLESAVRAVNMGKIERFLLKPCNEIELALAIREALVSDGKLAGVSCAEEPLSLESLVLEDLQAGITTVNKDENGYVLIEEDALEDE